MLHYVRQGNSGKTLVFIHGFLGSTDIYQSLINDLSLHFDCIAIDLPGHGKSEVNLEHYTVEEYANKIIDVLVHEKIEKAVWIGHSLGGYITLAALENHLFPIPKAILLHSAVNADDAAAKEKRTNQQVAIKKDGVDAFVSEVIPNFLSSKSSPKLTDQALEIAKLASIDGLVAALEAMKARSEKQTYIDQTSTPILVVEGEHDKIVPRIETSNETIQKVSVDAGHLGMIEDLDAVLQAIYSFLK